MSGDDQHPSDPNAPASGPAALGASRVDPALIDDGTDPETEEIPAAEARRLSALSEVDEKTDEVPMLGTESLPSVIPDFDDDPPTQRVEIDFMPSRYEIVQSLGGGPRTETFRVRDRELGRTVAMEILRMELAGSVRQTTRFRERAQLVARLQHPGIVPIYDVGELPDGRVFCTHKELGGDTLEVLMERHLTAQSSTTADLRRLVVPFLVACQAVAFAHERGVVHGALTAASIRVAPFGEIRVLGWGGAPQQATLAHDVDALGTILSRFPADPALRTIAVHALETPAHRPTAEGLVKAVGAWLYGG